jgi:hypothetical protein
MANDDELPRREDRAGRQAGQAGQAETARAERVRASAREAEGHIGGRPGRENGTWNTGDTDRDH